jgi:Reverse transcriptase (RNA-dependent DNA polymerase)
MRPKHVLDLVSCRESGPALLTAITGFVNALLNGKCNPAVSPIIFGGQLMALEKKSGGIRPIAIGYTWRRIAAKCANAHATAVLADYFQPIQLGVGTPGGCEAAVHATRRFVESMPSSHCVIKLDFSNAFNSLHRDVMLAAMRERVPGIYKFCHLSYSQPSVLSYAGRVILSQLGPQQGDPLGPALFCNTIQQLLTSLSSELRVGYMDDLTIGGPESQAARDVELVRTKGEEIGLRLNTNKCEFISHSAHSTDPIFNNFVHLSVDDAELLGAPITTGAAMDRALTRRCDDLDRAAGRLHHVTAHDALILLRASFSAPKLLHTLRTSPCSGHPALERFDAQLRSCVGSICNIDLSDIQWLQASLPVRNGGLGIRRVSSLAPSAFLASAAGTRHLQDQLLLQCQAPVDTAATQVLAHWTAKHNSLGITCPVGDAATKQRAWDNPCVNADANTVMLSRSDRRHQARLLAVSAPHSGDWLHALPITSCGLRLDDEAVRVAVGLRLGARLCEPHRCPCGSDVDPEGTHGLACRRSSGRTSRHHVINDLVWRSLLRADVPAIKEPAGLLRSDGKRPDGLTQIPWQSGRCMTWDVTVTDTLAESYLTSTSTVAGGAAEGAASRKEAKYQTLARTHTFIPLAFETLGPINAKGITFFNELGRRLAACSGDSRETAFLYQRLSIAIQRFNGICFHGSFTQQADTDSDS